MIDPPDLSPGSSPWDTNRTNRTRFSGGIYESTLSPTSVMIYLWYRSAFYENFFHKFV